jgi:hypothetical protein
MSLQTVGGNRVMSRACEAHSYSATGHAGVSECDTGSSVRRDVAEQSYRDVIVYCMEAECRNNVGNWPIESVSAGG